MSSSSRSFSRAPACDHEAGHRDARRVEHQLAELAEAASGLGVLSREVLPPAAAAAVAAAALAAGASLAAGPHSPPVPDAAPTLPPKVELAEERARAPRREEDDRRAEGGRVVDEDAEELFARRGGAARVTAWAWSRRRSRAWRHTRRGHATAAGRRWVRS